MARKAEKGMRKKNTRLPPPPCLSLPLALLHSRSHRSRHWRPRRLRRRPPQPASPPRAGRRRRPCRRTRWRASRRRRRRRSPSQRRPGARPWCEEGVCLAEAGRLPGWGLGGGLASCVSVCVCLCVWVGCGRAVPDSSVRLRDSVESGLALRPPSPRSHSPFDAERRAPPCAARFPALSNPHNTPTTHTRRTPHRAHTHSSSCTSSR